MVTLTEKRVYLSDLTLTSCGLTDKQLNSVLSIMPNLTKLTITHCQSLTDIAMCALLKNTSRLQTLCISFCMLLTDAVTYCIAAHSPHLQTIYVLRSVSMSVQVVLSEVLTHCPNIVEIIYSESSGRLTERMSSVEKQNWQDNYPNVDFMLD